jgi:hypothetical protein
MTETSLPTPPARARATRRGAALLLPCLLATACGTASAPTGPDATSHAVHAAQQQAAPADAVQLRSTLERLLGAHVLLADEFVRTAVTGDAPQNEALAKSVARNQAELVELVTARAAPPPGRSSRPPGRTTSTCLGEYATALQRRTPPPRPRPGSSTSPPSAARPLLLDRRRRHGPAARR